MIKFETLNIISCQDFDDLVITTFGKPYCLQQQNGCMSRQLIKINVPDIADDYQNISVPEEINGDEMGVSFKAWLSRDSQEWNGNPNDAQFISMFWERNFYPHIDVIINDLYKKGLLEAGDYIILID